MRQTVYHWDPSLKALGYGAAWPAAAGGAFAVSHPGQWIVAKGLAIPECPGGAGMYLKVARQGYVVVSGHNDDDKSIWEWRGAAWERRGWAWGPHAAAYRDDGKLVIIRTQDEYRATGGWRYCRADGTPVAVDATHAAHGLFDYTDFGDLAIGQLDDEKHGGGIGCVFADDGILRRISFDELRDHGQLHEVVANRDGDDVAITVVDQQAAKTTITEGTLAELRAMPKAIAIRVDPPKRPPVPPPPPPVSPPQEDDMHRPKVDIRSYDPVIRSGEMWRLVFADGNGDLVTVEKRENDSVHVRVENAMGEDGSGRFRPVRVVGDGS
jgi:hypothetical protein